MYGRTCINYFDCFPCFILSSLGYFLLLLGFLKIFINKLKIFTSYKPK